MITDIAIVTATISGQKLKGGIVHLESVDGSVLLMDITNPDGYAIFRKVTLPFSGNLKLGGTIDFYEVPVTIPEAVNVTLRVGPSPANPQDIQLPACSPSFG